MSQFYLILVDPLREEAARAAAAAADFKLDVHDLPSGTLFSAPGLGVLKLGPHGFVVGSVFHRYGPARPIAGLAPDEIAGIASGRETALARDYWGSYVSCMGEGETVRTFRDPSGGLPCYARRLARGLAFSSDAGLLIRMGAGGASVDWTALASHLYRAALPGRRTCLAQIEELLPGCSLIPAGPPEMLWSPAGHVAHSGAGLEALAEQLGRKVRAGIAGLTAGRERPLVSLSGGLDSSIVAACLAEAGRDFTCLTMYGPDPSGDERVYARAVASRLGATLVERAYRVEDVDVAAPLNAHLPRPMGRSQAIAYERVHMMVAAELGADAFVTGNGGDNVFAHSQTAAAIVDRWRAQRWQGFLATLGDTCRQTGCSPLAALRAARQIAKAPAGYRWRPDPALLSPEACAMAVQQGLSHPWLDAVPAPPGKAAHVAALLRVQQSIEPMRGRMIPVINPLLAQPIVEAALAIPSWRWREGGTDRGVARRAFSALLPARVVARRAKGGPDGFSRAVVTANHALIRDRLTGGRLVENGIVDPAALAAALAPGVAIAGNGHVRLQELLVAEAWLDHWAGVGPTP